MAVLLEGVLGEDSGESRKWISRAFRLAEPETHFAARKAFLFSIRVSGFGRFGGVLKVLSLPYT